MRAHRKCVGPLSTGVQASLMDDGTNDLLLSDVIRTNELQVWFLSEHLVDEPLV